MKRYLGAVFWHSTANANGTLAAAAYRRASGCRRADGWGRARIWKPSTIFCVWRHREVKTNCYRCLPCGEPVSWLWVDDALPALVLYTRCVELLDHFALRRVQSDLFEESSFLITLNLEERNTHLPTSKMFVG